MGPVAGPGKRDRRRRPIGSPNLHRARTSGYPSTKYLHTGIHYPGTIPSPRSPTQVSPWYPSLGSSHQWGSRATQKLTTTTTTTTTAIRDNHNNVLGAMWSNLGTQKAPWAWDILQPTSNTGTKYKQEDLCHRIPTIEFSPQLNNLSGLISSIS